MDEQSGESGEMRLYFISLTCCTVQSILSTGLHDWALEHFCRVLSYRIFQYYDHRTFSLIHCHFAGARDL